MVQFHLRHSKCDQAGKGADVVVGKMGSDGCPLSAIVEWLAGWAIFLGPIEEASPEAMFFGAVARSPLPDRVPPHGLRRAQFQDSGSHHGIAGGPRKLNDPDTGEVAECGLPPICQNPKGAGWPPCLPRWHLPQRHEPWSFSLSLCLSLLLISIIMFK